MKNRKLNKNCCKFITIILIYQIFYLFLHKVLPF